MGILDGGIRELFGQALAGLYLDGTLHGGTGAPIYAAGRITGYADLGDRDIKVQTDRVSQRTRELPDYEPGDVKLIVLAGDGTWSITTDSEITDGYGVTFRVRDVDQDAVRSHWICRGRRKL